MIRTLRVLLVALLLAAPASAQEPIRFARTPDISPDGKLITFSYLGDIWVVDAVGGVARPVTVHRAHDYYPLFSPDGKWIAFASNRHGSYNVFVIPTQSGKPRRLTFDSENEYPTGWSSDGKNILFMSSRNAAYPAASDMYSVPVEGGRVSRVTTTEGREGTLSPDGRTLAYVRGPGLWYRKGYRGSSNDDIWLCNAEGGEHRQFTAFNGQDGSPMWSADGRSIYYVSEFFGTPANIVMRPVDAADNVKPVQVTTHRTDAVRKARMSRDGQSIVYECGADLYVLATKNGSSPRKILIEVNTDEKSNTEQQTTFSNNATEFAPSPDDQTLVFAVHGELFMMRVGGNAKPVRMTQTGANNHGAQWSPDGSKILFLSDRDGHENLYVLEGNDPERPKFTEATRFKTTQLTRGTEGILGLTFSPDGKRITFVRAGKLVSVDDKGEDLKEIVSTPMVVDYEWGPDSKWLAYARMDGSFASEIYIIPATGATPENPVRNVTRYATYNSGITWSTDGKRLAFLGSRRSNASSLFVLPLQKPNAPGVPEKPATTPLEIDWDDIHLRAVPITSMPVDQAAISPDGKRVAFRASSQGDDLWVAQADGTRLTRMTFNNLRPQQITWSKRKVGPTDTLDVIFFRDGNNAIRMVKLGNDTKPDNSHLVTVGFQVKMVIRAEEEFREMFDQSWRLLSESFYDDKFHGANWKNVREKYRPLVKHVAMKEDFYSLVYLMLGELNASHLGIGGSTTTPEEMTASLGLLFDDAHRGAGLKIKEVLKRGPADQRGLNLKPGEYILAIDGVDVTEKTEVSTLLNGKVNEPIALYVAATPEADAKARRRVEVRGVDRSRIATLLYDRWVENNAKRVTELSKGKLGYIHIPNMQEDGLDKFVRSLYSDNYDKEAIVLDVRFNGGGFTHDQVLNYLGARDHTIFKQRNGGEGGVLRSYDRKWSKPLVLLQNNRSYSDAEIFPSAFRTLGLGKLVGQATGGYVIGTGNVQLVDGSAFRIPRIGVFTSKGVNMDKEGVPPDVLVEPHPEQLAKGQDVQLDKAVEVLLLDVVEWKKKHSGIAAKPDVPMMPPTKD